MPCSAITMPAALTAALAGLDSRYVTMIGQAEFMCDVRAFLIEDTLIGVYREHIASQLAKALLFMSTTIITIWVAYQGFMIITGANRNPVVPMMIKTGKMVLVMSLVALLAGQSPVIADAVDDFRNLISTAIVGSNIDIYQMIDLNLTIAMVFNMLVDSLVGGQLAGADGNSLTKVAALIGQSGPAVLVSVLALMAEISLVLAVMLSPLFLFFFLFQQTTAMFWSWVKFLLGTMVSLAVITLLGSIMMEMMMNYAGKVVAAFFANAAFSALSSATGGAVSGGFDISASAMQLGALGALSTALLTMVPPLIMGFFNSGAAFAGSALMAMGGAGAGLAGVTQALSGGAGAAGAAGASGTQGLPGAAGAAGGAGTPGLGYSGPPGAGAGSYGNNHALPIWARGDARGSPGSSAPLHGNTVGIGAHGNANVAQLQYQQSGSEFRGGSNYLAGGDSPVSGRTAGSGPNADGFYSNGTNVLDATIKSYEQQGIPVGSGGLLGVDGGSVGGSRALAQAPAGAASPGVAGPERLAAAPAVSDTPTHAMPRGQMGAANRLT